ncbi:MAG: hypothetical protein LBE38_08705, partial [Deltaproteobacteria bacterium]|nr:hypothetical protein [Deltaproteobacteria bacterium]
MKWTIAILQALASRRFFKIIPALIICLLVAACSGVVAETDLQSGPFNAPGDKGGQRDAIGGSESDSSGDSGSDKSLDNTSGNGIALGGDSGDGNTSRERALPAASGLNSKPSAPGEKGASVTGASGGSGENGAGDLGDSSLKGAKKKAAEGTGVLGEPREL